MHTKLKKINEGFTIVETLIVLAIAALIITIVLIAVPALQRSAANTNILHDAQDIASTIQTFEGNNQGTLPGYIGQNGSNVCIALAAPAVGSSSSCNGDQAKVQGSDQVASTSGSTTAVGYKASGGAGSNFVGPGGIFVDLQAQCGTQGNTNTPTANIRGVAIFYPIEASSASGSQVGCIQV